MANNGCRQLHKIFVYGSLKHGQPNYQYMIDGRVGLCRFVCEAMTKLTYPMVIATRWNLPFLLHVPGVGKTIRGEVYEVDDTFMEWADVFEDLYERKELQVDIMQKGQLELNKQNTDGVGHMSCWAYFLQNYPEEILKLPFYSSYDSSGKHGRIYSPAKDNATLDQLDEALIEEVTVNILQKS